MIVNISLITYFFIIFLLFPFVAIINKIYGIVENDDVIGIKKPPYKIAWRLRIREDC